MSRAYSQRDNSRQCIPDQCVNKTFALVAETHRGHIFRFLLTALRDPDLAETLTQECLLRAYRGWATFHGKSSVRTWLTRIAINVQKDHWRSRRVQFWKQVHSNAVELRETSDWIPCTAMSPEAYVVERDKAKHVWRAVGNLTERQRLIVRLRFREGLDPREIAQMTGLHEGTVKSHLSRAVFQLRRLLAVARQKSSLKELQPASQSGGTMQNQLGMLLAAFVLGTASMANAQDQTLNGHWEGTIQRGNVSGKVTVDLQQSQAELRGVLSDPSKQTLRIQNGKVEANSFSFDATAMEHGQPRLLHFVGSVSGDVIHIHTTDGKRDGPVLTLTRR